MKEITEELLDRMSHKVVVKLATLTSAPPVEVVEKPKPKEPESNPKDPEAVVKQVLRDELT